MHIPVLFNETIELLNPKEGDVIIDGTLGSAGHAMKICKRIGKSGTLIGMDQDVEMMAVAKKNLENCEECKCKKIFVNDNFRNLDKCLVDLKNEKVDGVMFDLGLNSRQLEESGRGFTFQKDEPLLMTFQAADLGIESSGALGHSIPKLTAGEILNEWREEDIADVLFKYGDERFGRRIAKGIIERRRKKFQFKTTFDLVDVIRVSVPAFYRNPSTRSGQANRKTNCCTKTFQALRIAVNDEMGALDEGLRKAWNALTVGGRLAVISFHSLEDRMVKVFFKELATVEEPSFAKATEGRGKILTKKPIVATEDEIRENPRSRSAKLRGIEKTN